MTSKPTVFLKAFLFRSKTLSGDLAKYYVRYSDEGVVMIIKVVLANKLLYPTSMRMVKRMRGKILYKQIFTITVESFVTIFNVLELTDEKIEKALAIRAQNDYSN